MIWQFLIRRFSIVQTPHSLPTKFRWTPNSDPAFLPATPADKEEGGSLKGNDSGGKDRIKGEKPIPSKLNLTVADCLQFFPTYAQRA